MSSPPPPQRPPRQQTSRLGPRPLPLHLATLWWSYASSLPALTLWNSGLLPLKGTPPNQTPANQAPPSPTEAPLDALRARVAQLGVDPFSLAAAVERAGRQRLSRFMTGVQRYRSHPYQRTLKDPPVLWQSGAAQLLDYGAEGAVGPVMLFVPSLVNRAYVLDLSADRSLLRWLAGQGIRPLLLDWGSPEEEERSFSLADYIGGPLEGALEAAGALARETGEKPPILAGYCMGGLLALAAALRQPQAVGGLALLATPWDFHAGDGVADRFRAGLPLLERVIDWHGVLPVDAIQSLFFGLDPLQVLKKFDAFSRADPDSEKATAFVALEDWLNDGVPLAAPVARDCLAGWYIDNLPMRGRWRVAGRIVDPHRLVCPTLLLVPSNDRIVPPASALALAAAIPQAEVLKIPLGHIGMVVASNARRAVWEPLAAWAKKAAIRPPSADGQSPQPGPKLRR